ncbi:MAG: hypothetical protein Ct9H300mP16_11830 [Pseudomonadota bacterium]|nr:MAG: hypothetical protein Ct9H300mP16_11830 [Pseudomonadota bacterium]
MTQPVDPYLIDQWLPQTQCRKCGLPSCHDYAASISRGESPINRCPPGGDVTIRALSRLTSSEIIPLDPGCGAPREPATALIDEDHCIGCTLCIQACPVDAICGAAKQMHTILATECTGCELCVEPCPVDCIKLVRRPETLSGDPSPWAGYSLRAVQRARRRTLARRPKGYAHNSPPANTVACKSKAHATGHSGQRQTGKESARQPPHQSLFGLNLPPPTRP